LNRWLADPRPYSREFRDALEREEATMTVRVVSNLVRLTRRSTRASDYVPVMHPARMGLT